MGVEDWDWIDNVLPEVTSEKYFSPPYSIRATESGTVVRGLCKAPDTLYIPNGRIELVINDNNDTWITQPYIIYFRAVQAPGETTAPSEYYIFVIHPGLMEIRVTRYEGGIVVEKWSHDIYTDVWNQLNPLEWNWFRLTWWSVAGIGLIARAEVKINSMWYRICDDFEGITDMYTNRTYNRVGIFLWWQSGMNPSYIDNIRIYKAV